MKKVMLSCFLLCGCLCSWAQEGEGPVASPPQAAYLQFGGSGPVWSIQYDRRFRPKRNGAGFAAGVGYWGSQGVNAVSIPVSLNYLIGKQKHFLELAGGTTFLTGTVEFYGEASEGSGFVHHLSAGYRLQPLNKGLFLRAGLSPLFFGSESVLGFYLGVGAGF
ncbi:MAG TPA: hypothetical protein VGN63_04345 [Flavisolibacter sp.]|jgi:hypothetical protein|nr:hypothetical protein [Flavisolibacter sp.]